MGDDKVKVEMIPDRQGIVNLVLDRGTVRMVFACMHPDGVDVWSLRFDEDRELPYVQVCHRSQGIGMPIVAYESDGHADSSEAVKEFMGKADKLAKEPLHFIKARGW